MFLKEKISNEILDKLVLYMVPATVIGARLGHVFFYGPYWGEEGYLSHPIEIFKIWEGGLASHGAAVVILIALWYFSKKVIHKSFLWILDRIAAPIAIAGTFIRLGNLVNHEMVGHETNLPWGFRFLHHDCMKYFDEMYHCSWSEIPVRHPAQLYEAICYLISFIILMILYWKKEAWKKQGMVFGSFLILIFGFRFIIEFFKLNQDSEQLSFVFLNTGQILSIPFVLVGLYLIFSANRKSISDTKCQNDNL